MILHITGNLLREGFSLLVMAQTELRDTLVKTQKKGWQIKSLHKTNTFTLLQYTGYSMCNEIQCSWERFVIQGNKLHYF